MPKPAAARRLNRVKFREWLAIATPRDRRDLLKGAKLSSTMLTHMTKLPDSIGYVDCSADVAARVEAAAKPISQGSRGDLPMLTRADLCLACRECPFYHRGKRQEHRDLDAHYAAIGEVEIVEAPRDLPKPVKKFKTVILDGGFKHRKLESTDGVPARKVGRPRKNPLPPAKD